VIRVHRAGQTAPDPVVSDLSVWRLPTDAVWIDLIKPTTEEDAAVEKALGLNVPTRAEMAELEASSRIYREDGAAYVTADIVTHGDEEIPGVEPVTFIITNGPLVTIRYVDPKPFSILIDKLEREPHLCTTGPELFLNLMETVVDRVSSILSGTVNRVEAIAGLRQIDLDLGRDPAWVGREYEDAVAHQHRLLDIVGNDQHRFDRHPSFRPQVEQIGTQRFRRQHIECRERFVHQQQRRIDDDRARQPNALAHPARQLLGIGVLKPVEADQVDRGERAGAAFVSRHALRFQAQLDILEHGQPREKRECLEHHAYGVCRPIFDMREPDDAFVRPNQARDRAQQRGLSRTRPAQQPNDLILVQRQADIIEDSRAAVALAVAMTDMLDLDERTPSRQTCGECCHVGSFQGFRPAAGGVRQRRTLAARRAG